MIPTPPGIPTESSAALWGVKVVRSFDELVATPFASGFNALCWPRALPGDFEAIVAQLGDGEGIAALDEARLRVLPLGEAGRTARDILLADQQMLRARGLAPELNCLYGYPRDETAAAVRTDVYSFHADSAPVATDTYLCTYYGPTSEGLRNDEARRRVDIPETRVELLKEYGGEDDDSFLEYLRENCYDLHYIPVPSARPYSFGLGNLWRIAIAYPGSPVAPCVHRAPETQPGQPRLLLIS